MTKLVSSIISATTIKENEKKQLENAIQKHKMNKIAISDYTSDVSEFLKTCRKAHNYSQSEEKNAIMQCIIALKMVAANANCITTEATYRKLQMQANIFYHFKIESDGMNEKAYFGTLYRQYAEMRNNAKNEWEAAKNAIINEYAGNAICLLLEQYYEYSASVALRYMHTYSERGYAPDAMQNASVDCTRLAILQYCKNCIEIADYEKFFELKTCIHNAIKFYSLRFWRITSVVTPSLGDSGLTAKNEKLRERNRHSYLSTEYSVEDNEGNSISFGDSLTDERLNAFEEMQKNERYEIIAKAKVHIMNGLSEVDKAIFEGLWEKGLSYSKLHSELKEKMSDYPYESKDGLYYHTQTLLKKMRTMIEDEMK